MVQDGGERFSKALLGFCREFAPTFPELQRLLTMKLGPVDFGKVKDECQGSELRLKRMR